MEESVELITCELEVVDVDSGFSVDEDSGVGGELVVWLDWPVGLGLRGTFWLEETFWMGGTLLGS